MFCPKCSQQQITDDVRFCSRCGFQLNLVKALIAADGNSPSKTSEFTAAERPRRIKDMTIGAVLMFFFAMHSAWTTEDLSLDREYTSLIVKCLILCALINSGPAIRDFFFGNATHDGPSLRKTLSRLTAKFKNKAQQPALPAAYGRPAAADYFTGRIETAELVAPPPSVTEDTTNLLRNN